MLLEHGADANASNNSGKTALILGAGGQGDEIAAALLAKGADVDARDDKGVTALMSAAFFDNAPAVRLLLDSGADIRARTATGETALILAGGAGSAELLLDSGADVNAERADGRTALMEAALTCDQGMVGVLLEHNADANARDDSGRTAMIWALRAEDRWTGLELQNDLTWNLLKTRSGLYRETPARQAHADAMLKDVLTALLKGGADVNARDDDGWSALKLAKVRMKRAIVKLLTAAGAVLSPEDVMHLDFLSAVKNENVDKARRLIAKGVDVNAANHKGVTALGISAYWNHVEIAKLFLDAGADVSIPDDDGVTALEHAERRGNNEIAELINDKRRLS